VRPAAAQPARTAPRVARRTVCAAQPERPALATTLAAAALAAAVSLGAVDAAQADVSGLTPCKDSKQFAKRQKNELKALDKRLKLVGSTCSCSDQHVNTSHSALVAMQLPCPAPLHVCGHWHNWQRCRRHMMGCSAGA
jgi:Photosystem I reaction centre subunit III